MTALAADRNTARRDDIDRRLYGVAAAAKIYAGALVMVNASGYATKGQTALALIGAGMATEQVDNTNGAAGDLNVNVREGVFLFGNSASTDQITIADVGEVCYAVDDQTVAKTSGSGTRSPAGLIVAVDSLGVQVELNPRRLKAWVKARKRTLQLVLTTVAGSGSPAYRIVSPFAGLMTKLRSVIEAALTTADATVTVSIAGNAVTNGVLTLTQSGSAAGDKATATPTAANYVAAGDEIKAVVTGTQASAVRANLTIELDVD